MENETQSTKKSQNSPSISRPAFNIKKAIDFAQKIYDENSLNAFDGDILAKIFGNSSIISSSFMKNKAALIHYNLIEKITNGNNAGLLKITEPFLQYLTELDLIKKQELLYSFFYNPTIFKFIKEIIPDLNNINKDVLVMQVIRNKKIEKSIAEEIANNFISSYTYIKSLNTGIENSSTAVERITDLNKEVDIPQEEKEVINEVKPTQLPIIVSAPVVYDDKKEANKASKGIIWNLSNNENFSIHLPDNLKDLLKEDLMEILDVIEVVTKKVKRQIEIKND